MPCEWAGGKVAADFLGRSRDFVEDRALPWQPKPEPGRVRYRMLFSGPHKRSRREYYMADVRNLLIDPPRQRSSSIEYAPRFHREGTAA